MWYVYTKRTQTQKPYAFEDLVQDQEYWFQNRAEWYPQKAQGVLLLAELEPVVTLGTRLIHQSKKFDDLKLHWVAGNRGGNETWHGPGQWVGFVITPLDSFVKDSKGVRKSVYKILDLLLPLIREYKDDAEIRDGDALGIWSKKGKLVSVGIKVRQGWINSGFALNVYETPHSFKGIFPCGLQGAKADFIFSKESVNNVFFNEVGVKIKKIFECQN